MQGRLSLVWGVALCGAAALLGVAGAPAVAGRAAARVQRGPPVALEAVAQRLDQVLKTGLNTINADEVAALLMDADPANDPFVLDVRERKDFLRGHVPGAVNVPLRKLPSAWRRRRDLVPAGRNVVVVSYYGGDGNMASLLVNAVRITDPGAYTAFPWSKAMFMGMAAWSFDPALCNGHRYDSDVGVMRVDRGTETTANAAGSFEAPPVRIRSRTVEDAILERAQAALRAAKRPNDLQVPATALAAAFDAGGPAPQVLSVRSGADYAKGHIPGAVNIGWKDVAAAANSVKVDPSRPVFVYCYTGHTGSLAAMALRMLGYDARNVLYGMDGWRPSAAVGAGRLTNFDLSRGWDFPVDAGASGGLGSLAAWRPPAGCLACHTNLTAVWYDRTVANPPPAPPAAPTVGEG